MIIIIIPQNLKLLRKITIIIIVPQNLEQLLKVISIKVFLFNNVLIKSHLNLMVPMNSNDGISN